MYTGQTPRQHCASTRSTSLALSACVLCCSGLLFFHPVPPAHPCHRGGDSLSGSSFSLFSLSPRSEKNRRGVQSVLHTGVHIGPVATDIDVKIKSEGKMIFSLSPPLPLEAYLCSAVR